MRIIVDVMGGDHAPFELVKGVHLARAMAPEHDYILVGDEMQIREVAAAEGIGLNDYTIVNASDVITMEDDPMSVVRQKSNSSMSVALHMLADKQGDAVVSTGNTGALFTGSNLIVRRLQGVRRPAIATLLPLNHPILLLDAGANLRVDAEYLEQFAVMGSAYMKKVHGMEAPRVGLLNNGTEPTKGGELQLAAYALLSSCPYINFVGNIEANRLREDICDVVVTDGFTGNILLKSLEGMGKMMLQTMKDIFYENARTKLSALLVREKLMNVKKQYDPSEYGGSPLLGIAAPVIKAHGSSRAKAFRSAVLQAIAYCETDVFEQISSDVSALHEWRKHGATPDD